MYIFIVVLVVYIFYKLNEYFSKKYYKTIRN